MPNKRFTLFKLFAMLLLVMSIAGPSAYAKGTDVKVYLDGKPLPFEGQPVIKNGTTLVPFRALFEALGFTVTWNDAAKQAAGTKAGLNIELTINSASARVNGQPAPLAVPAQIINGKTMIPLRFVSENSGYHVDYSAGADTITIEISSQAGKEGTNAAGGAAGAADDKLEPYVVKGRVVNTAGMPVQGALVTADNLLLYNSNAQAVTDADGRYRIPLGLMAATYRVTAEYTTEYNGKKYTVDLVPDNDDPFAGNEGAVRHFTVSLDSSAGLGGSGFVLFYMMDLIHPLDPVLMPPDREHVILTLTPQGKQLDGSVGGPPIVGHGTNTPDGFGLHNVPVGVYKVTATYAPPGEEPQPLLVRIVSRGKDNEFTESVTAEFDSITSKIHKIELELKLNVTKEPEDPWEWNGEPEEWNGEPDDDWYWQPEEWTW